MTGSARLTAYAFAFGACALAVAAAQQPPTFRSSVEYVEVDVVVTNQQGQFVRDLTRDDFQLLEDGKRQEIASFTLIDIPVEKYERPLFASQPIEPDVRSNERPFDGRVYVMVVDDLHTDPLRVQRTKGAARQFIEERLGANDMMAVVHTAGPDSASQEFTNSKRLLLAAVDKTMGRAIESSTAIANRNAIATRGNVTDDTSIMERAMNAQTTLAEVRDIANWFATVHGRRKSILLVSEGIDYDITAVMEPRAGVVIDAAREAIDAAMRSNVSIYGIDPRGLTGIDDISIEYANGPGDAALGTRALMNQQRVEADSLRTLSEETGGMAVVGTNNLARAYDAIVSDNSSYYVLAYAVPGDKRDGKFHKIDVRTNRPGLVARARRGYLAPKGKAPVTAPVTSGPSSEVREALRSPLPVSGLTMSVALAPFKGTAPNASVLFAAELRGAGLDLQANNALEFSYTAVDAKGKVRGGSNDKILLNALREETKSRIEASGLRVFNRVELPPGRYQVRLAAHDQGGGSVGSVTYDLEVPDFYALPFSMSGLAITSLSTGSMVVVKADEQLKDVLPAPPVVERRFPQSDELAVFAEIYDNEKSTAHKVNIETTLTTDAGAVVFTTNDERSSTELGGARGGYGYTARVPLSDVPPGRYVLGVQARSTLGRNVGAGRQVEVVVTAKK